MKKVTKKQPKEINMAEKVVAAYHEKLAAHHQKEYTHHMKVLQKMSAKKKKD